MQNFGAKWGVGLVITLTLTACTPDRPAPELVRAAEPGPGTPTTVSGNLLKSCVADPSFNAPQNADKEARYSPSKTYFLAEKLRNSTPEAASYATLLRGYTVKTRATGIFLNTLDLENICYYELKNENLRYLTVINVGVDERASRYDVAKAAVKAYSIMADKPGPSLF